MPLKDEAAAGMEEIQLHIINDCTLNAKILTSSILKIQNNQKYII